MTSRCGGSLPLTPSLHHGAVLSPGSDWRTVPLSSQHTLCESALTPFTLEIPSKPQASWCLFCSRPYAEHRGKKWKKTQPLISGHLVGCTRFQKQPLRAVLAKMSDGRWDVTSEVHRRFGGQAEFKQRNLPFCGRFQFKRKVKEHRQVDSYIRVLNMWIQQSLLNSLCFAHDRVCVYWSGWRRITEITRCLNCYDIR